jgi:hypothetical protein
LSREAKRAAKEKKEAEKKAAKTEGGGQPQVEKTGLRKRLHL